jgi:hypothetical protein
MTASKVNNQIGPGGRSLNVNSLLGRYSGFSSWPECGLPRCLAGEPRAPVSEVKGMYACTSPALFALEMASLMGPARRLHESPEGSRVASHPTQLRQATLPRGELPWGQTNTS